MEIGWCGLWRKQKSEEKLMSQTAPDQRDQKVIGVARFGLTVEDLSSGSAPALRSVPIALVAFVDSGEDGDAASRMYVHGMSGENF